MKTNTNHPHAKTHRGNVIKSVFGYLSIWCSIFCIQSVYCQVPEIGLPKPSSFTRPGIIGYSTPQRPQVNNTAMTSVFNANRYQDQMAMVEADMERVRMEEIRKRQLLRELETNNFRDVFHLPSHRNKAEAQFYKEAYNDLLEMAERKLSYKKSVFTVENAFYEGEKNYEEFERTVERTGDFLREKMQELGYDENSNLAKNFLLFQFFADTLELKGKDLKHLPLVYDFNDYRGQDDWTNMFVHKLLETGKGQCNSMPRLYLILAEEIGATAYLAYSPNHTYIKFPDDNGLKWYNVELTNGMLTTDAFILQSGYIKAEALQNRIFMHPLTDREFMAGQISELTNGYISKFGYDDFAYEMAEKALELSPTCMTAHLIKSNYLTKKFHGGIAKLGITRENFNDIRYYPKAVEHYKKMAGQYDKVDALGYEEMPEEMYLEWLASLEKEKQKQDNKAIRLKMDATINN